MNSLKSDKTQFDSIVNPTHYESISVTSANRKDQKREIFFFM